MYSAPTSKGASSSTNTLPRPILPGHVRFRKTIDFGNAATNCFDFEEALSFLSSPIIQDEKGRKGLLASPVYIVDPCQSGLSPLRTAGIFPNGQLTTAQTAALGNVTGIQSYLGHWHIFKGGPASSGTLAQYDPEYAYGSYGTHSVSAAATANVVNLDTRNLSKSLAIRMVASGAATATLTVEVSTDLTNFLTIDTLVAAATQTKQYVEATVGAGIALSPLSFRYIRITAGSAGGADTTTLDIGLK